MNFPLRFLRPAAVQTPSETVGRQMATIMLAEHILTHPVDWGVLDPERCREIAQSLLYLRWLVREGRVTP